MIVYCTERFENEILSLQKNNSYKDILIDVCEYFSDKNINELHITRDIISNAKGKYSLNKFRIQNSTMKKGKSGSYRCVSVCLPEEDTVVLGVIYPKTGSDGLDNLQKEEYKKIAKLVKEALTNKKYKKINIPERKFIPL